MTKLVSAAHSLKLVDLEGVAIYSRARSQVILSWHPGAKQIQSIPGTVRLTSSRTEKGYEKQITFSLVSEGYTLGDMLFFFSKKRLIAVYTDARGYLRVCGSPEHPLRLTYTIQEGIASVSLTGTDTHDDGFLLLG